MKFYAVEHGIPVCHKDMQSEKTLVILATQPCAALKRLQRSRSFLMNLLQQKQKRIRCGRTSCFSTAELAAKAGVKRLLATLAFMRKNGLDEARKNLLKPIAQEGQYTYDPCWPLACICRFPAWFAGIKTMLLSRATRLRGRLKPPCPFSALVSPDHDMLT